MRTLVQPSKWRGVYEEYPSQFWVLVTGGFVDRVGGTMLFPFFAIYIAQNFDVGLTTIGYVFLIGGIAGAGGSFVGGPITDRFGRKGAMILGLLASAGGSLGIGLAPTLTVMLAFFAVAGFFGAIGEPAAQAMIADLIPEAQRGEAYGIQRVVMNMAWIVGPLLGGAIALQSYLLLFIIDAVTSTIMATIILLVIRESHNPADHAEADRPEMTLVGTLRSYRPAVTDRTFMTFAGLVMMVQFVYFQMYVTLPYWMVDVVGMRESAWSIMLAVNASMVVLFQFPIMRRTKTFPPLLVLASASVFFAFGYGLYAVISGLLMFVFAMTLITIGEMLFFPTAQAVAANLSPASMRGRYMAVYGFAHAIPSSVGTLPAGLVMDNYSADLFWVGAGVAALLTALAYYSMRRFGIDTRGAAAGEDVPAGAGAFEAVPAVDMAAGD